MKNIKNIAVFLAARSGSKRLPNKHFLKVNSNLRFIDLCILRLKKVKLVKQIYLCTTNNKVDDKFEDVCKLHKIKIFRGSANNVLKRFIDCAKENYIETIIRITADCPIVDPSIIDECIRLHFLKKNDYTTNTLKLTFPDGLDVEIIDIKSLIKSYRISKSILNKEHVTYYIKKSNNFKKYNYQNFTNYSNRRWTLDTYEDYLYLQKAIKFFLPKKYFYWKDLIKAEKKNNYLINIKKR